MYLDGETVIEKIKSDEDGSDITGQIDKKFFEDIIKSVDYLPFLEMAMDIIEYTKEYDKGK
jgi:hypothetical protein